MTTMVVPSSVQLLQQVQDGRAGGGVQVAGGLVGHHQGRPAGQGPGDGGALLLAAGELVGPVPEPVAEPDPLDGRLGQLASLADPPAPVQQPVGHVVEHAEPSRRKNCWNTKPSRQARSPDSCLSVMVEVSSPATRTTPAVGRSSVPITCNRVLLPDPEGPTMATSSPGSIRRLTPARATTGGSPGYSLTTSTSSSTGQRRPTFAGRDGHGHEDGTSTRVPAVRPAPLTWTRVLLYRPVVTPTRWWSVPVTTSTP